MATQTTMTNTSVKSSQKESGTPPLKEFVDILRVLNTNVYAQRELLDKQSHLMTGESDFNDTQYDYEYNDDGNESCPSQIEFEGDSVQVSQDSTSTSIFKELSNKFHQSEQVYVDVHTYLANLVNNLFRNGLSDYSLDEIKKNKYTGQKTLLLLYQHVLIKVYGDCLKVLPNQKIQD